jgi:predicted ester cyclase
MNFLRQWDSFPDLSFTIEQMVAEGDRVSTLLAMDGTHTGPWLGIPPNGKRIGVLPATDDLLQEFRERKE